MWIQIICQKIEQLFILSGMKTDQTNPMFQTANTTYNSIHPNIFATNNHISSTIQPNMQRPCAYCKIQGHHIRDCEERKAAEERKRNSAQPASSQNWQTVRSAATTPKYVPPPLRKVETVNNKFANLYSSSDDEIEEGEIVEDRRPIAVSDSESDSGSIYESDSTPASWNRSGIKGVFVPQCTDSSSDGEGKEECDYAVIDASLKFISEYLARFKGMKWEDIESEDEENP